MKSTREDAYVTGNFTVTSMTSISRQVIDYQIKRKYNSVALILHSTSDESWEVDISRPNDSVTLNWIHKERLFAKGPTSGVLTTKEASFAGRRKR